MRCFAALDLPQTARDAIAQLQEEARKCDVDASFVNPDQQHVTLVFLGEVQDSRVPALVEAFKQLKLESFRVQLKGTGFFPSAKFVKVFWIGAEGGKELLALQERLAVALQARETREFNPHVAVCRPKTNRNLDCLRALQQARAQEEFASFKAQTVTFYKSELGPAGPTYAALAQLRAT